MTNELSADVVSPLQIFHSMTDIIPPSRCSTPGLVAYPVKTRFYSSFLISPIVQPRIFENRNKWAVTISFFARHKSLYFILLCEPLPDLCSFSTGPKPPSLLTPLSRPSQTLTWSPSSKRCARSGFSPFPDSCLPSPRQRFAAVLPHPLCVESYSLPRSLCFPPRPQMRPSSLSDTLFRPSQQPSPACSLPFASIFNPKYPRLSPSSFPFSPPLSPIPPPSPWLLSGDT